ncbi:MAG TPA: hypothetical protein VE131_14260 [Terriglobales bacterium]|nr:hypothetical protein [Terriglobales bacterium]
MAAVQPPRAIFVDHPVGRTFGPPGDRKRHEQVLAAVLGLWPNFSRPGELWDLGCQWDPSGNRTWEEELRTLLLDKNR